MAVVMSSVLAYLSFIVLPLPREFPLGFFYHLVKARVIRYADVLKWLDGGFLNETTTFLQRYRHNVTCLRWLNIAVWLSLVCENLDCLEVGGLPFLKDEI